MTCKYSTSSTPLSYLYLADVGITIDPTEWHDTCTSANTELVVEPPIFRWPIDNKIRHFKYRISLVHKCQFRGLKSIMVIFQYLKPLDAVRVEGRLDKQGCLLWFGNFWRQKLLIIEFNSRAVDSVFATTHSARHGCHSRLSSLSLSQTRPFVLIPSL